MLAQILDGLFFGLLIYMLARVLFGLLCSPRFYEFILLVTAPMGTYHYTNDLRVSLMAFVLSGLSVLLFDTAFQPERNRTTSPVLVANNGFTIDQARAEREATDGLCNKRKAI